MARVMVCGQAPTACACGDVLVQPLRHYITQGVEVRTLHCGQMSWSPAFCASRSLPFDSFILAWAFCCTPTQRGEGENQQHTAQFSGTCQGKFLNGKQHGPRSIEENLTHLSLLLSLATNHLWSAVVERELATNLFRFRWEDLVTDSRQTVDRQGENLANAGSISSAMQHIVDGCLRSERGR
jgi:hypothetical protein